MQYPRVESIGSAKKPRAARRAVAYPPARVVLVESCESTRRPSRRLGAPSPTPRARLPGLEASSAVFSRREPRAGAKTRPVKSNNAFAASASSTMSAPRRSIELCPRSYDDMERAELDELRVQFDSLPPVTVLQDASIGIPGAVYDCSIALAAHLVDEILPEAWHDHAAASRRAGPKILELGCGVGACGALVLAAAAARGVPLDVTLTDRNPGALRLARRNVDAALRDAAARDGSSSATMCTATITPFDFADDPTAVLDARARPDVVLCSDVLYAPESAAPLARALSAILRRSQPRASSNPTRGESVLDSPADARAPACYLAWRPRPGNPNKTSAVKAFLSACEDERLRAADAPTTRDGTGTRPGERGVVARVWDANRGEREGWSATFDPMEAAEKGLRILKIESAA